MKTLKVFSALLVGVLFSSHALAALSIVGGHFVQGNPPGTCAISSSVGTGQAVVVVLETGSGAGSLTITDTVNTANYSVLYSPTSAYAIYWIKTNASGTPAISISGTTTYTYYQCFAITGFTGTPTPDTAIQSTASGTSTSPAINATSNFNTEMLIAQVFTSAFQSVTVSGWTAASGTSGFGFYAFEATSGTANNFSGSIGTSAAWHLTLAGIYDLPAGTCIHNGHAKNGSISVPNGSTGLYWSPTGNWVTPDCSTIRYLSPQLGNFVVN